MPSRQMQYQAGRAAAGLCRRCRNPAAQNARTGKPGPFCSDCRRKASEAERARRQAVKVAAEREAAMAAGECLECGAPLTLRRRIAGQEYCDVCQPVLPI